MNLFELSINFQMETTPRTRSSTRYRRAPTPKMSERKKKLFDDVVSNGDSPTQRNPYVRLERIIAEEGDIDSDIGPMSPLEFSSSPSSFNEVHRIMAREQKGKAGVFLISSSPNHKSNVELIYPKIPQNYVVQTSQMY